MFWLKSWPISGHCSHFILPENTRRKWEHWKKMGTLARNGLTKKKIKIRFKSNGTYSGNKNSIAQKTWCHDQIVKHQEKTETSS